MRKSLRNPISELELAATLLDAATESALSGDLVQAGNLLAKADFPEIIDYAKSMVGKMSKEIHRQTRRPATLPPSERDPARMPARAEQRRIFSRDGWRCRFCEAKVISRGARAVFARLFPIEAHWTSIEFQRHSALYAMASSLDHVIPHSRGGKNQESNFVTACYCCQFGRGEWTLEEVELSDPREREPVVDEWDGLVRLEGLTAGIRAMRYSGGRA